MNSDQYLKKNDQDLNGQTLIKKPVKRDLTRVGVVDIGSNSVRLVVFDGAGRSRLRDGGLEVLDELSRQRLFARGPRVEADC